MDPASAIIGFVGFGLTVFQKVDAVIRSLKGATNDLKAIRDRSADIQVLLIALQQTNNSIQPSSPQETAYRGRLESRVQVCLEAINAFAEKVQHANELDAGTGKVKKLKWLLKRKDFEALSQQLKDLEISLGLMMAFVNS